ncbi:hypothetical protein [Bacillus sp. 03113]|nr:hypothetical protein [Bacillus sp. 03113]
MRFVKTDIDQLLESTIDLAQDKHHLSIVHIEIDLILDETQNAK